jgi:quinol---cytochrome c reductase cytochrome c subunit, bacillus type
VAAQAETRAPAQVRPRREREQEVLVWPDLVFVEFICAVVFSITFIAMSIIYDAPLLTEANSNITPNPSKAPWYFLNLQELLLHMDKGLAGVIVPTIAILLLMALPYVDRSNEGQGVWFGTRNAVKIALFSVGFAAIVTTALIMFDEGKHVQAVEELGGEWPSQLDALQNRRAIDSEGPWPDWSRHIKVPFNDVPPEDLPGGDDGFIDKFLYPDGLYLNFPAIFVEQIIPVVLMFGLPIVMCWILYELRWARSVRDFSIAIFSGFVSVFWLLTIVGSFFRGPGQLLIWPWELEIDDGCGPGCAPEG